MPKVPRTEFVEINGEQVRVNVFDSGLVTVSHPQSSNLAAEGNLVTPGGPIEWDNVNGELLNAVDLALITKEVLYPSEVCGASHRSMDKTRSILVRSDRWGKLVVEAFEDVGLDQVVPIEMRDWTDEDHDLARGWAMGHQPDVPPKIQAYIDGIIEWYNKHTQVNMGGSETPPEFPFTVRCDEELNPPEKLEQGIITAEIEGKPVDPKLMEAAEKLHGMVTRSELSAAVENWPFGLDYKPGSHLEKVSQDAQTALEPPKAVDLTGDTPGLLEAVERAQMGRMTDAEAEVYVPNAFKAQAKRFIEVMKAAPTVEAARSAARGLENMAIACSAIADWARNAIDELEKTHGKLP